MRLFGTSPHDGRRMTGSLVTRIISRISDADRGVEDRQRVGHST